MHPHNNGTTEERIWDWDWSWTGFVGYLYQAPLEILTSVTSLWERVYSVETAQLKEDEVEQGEPAQTLSEAVLQATLVEIQAISKCRHT